MSSDSHWIIPAEPPGGGTWKGCALLEKPDGGDFVLFSPNALYLSAVLQIYNTHERSRVDNASQATIQDTEMTEFMVMGRCRHLLDGYSHVKSQSPSSKMSESLAKVHAELKGKRTGGQRFITAAYIGFDPCMQGPVFARAAKDAAGPNSTKFNEPEEPNGAFDLKDLTFSCDLASPPAGGGFIPHFAITSCANMDVLRKLLTGHSMENLFCDSDISEYLLHVRMFVKDLKNGGSLEPFVNIVPDVSPYLSPGKDLRNIFDANDCCPCDQNRPFSEIACNTELLARQDKDGVLSGYRYQAALIEALDYPDELICMLKDFGTLYPNDILPLRTLLLACHLWADITGNRTLYLERFFENCEDQSAVPQVPDIPLAVCLIYYPHWLKWTQWMGLSEFPHPFRFMSQAVKSDMDNEAIGIDPDSIDQGRAYSLIAKAKSRIPLMDATHRVEIMPCYMPGSTMPPMFGAKAKRPEKVPLALTGLPEVQYLGLNTYTRPDNSKDERPVRLQSIRRTSKYTTVTLPRHVSDSLFATPGKLFESSLSPDEASSNITEKRRMEQVESEDSMTGRPPKRLRGPDVIQRDKFVAELTAGAMSSVSAGPGLVPACSTNEEILKTWDEARRGVAHWAHHDGLQLFKNLPEGEQSRAKLRELIKLAFEQEEKELMHLVTVTGVLNTRSPRPAVLSDEFLSTNIPLALGTLLGLRVPKEPMPDLWRSHFMPQCVERDDEVWQRAQSIQSALQISRGRHSVQQKLKLDEVKEVYDEIHGRTSGDWRSKLEKFLADDESSTICWMTEEELIHEEGSIYEEGVSDEETSSDEESS